MAITKTAEKQNPDVPRPAPAAPKFVVLELAVYKRYSRSGHLYTDENAYKFTEDQAEILLSEVDATSGRPIWKRYKPVAAPVPTGHKRAMDVTSDNVQGVVEEQTTFDAPNAVRRLEIGSDDELEQILPKDIIGSEDTVIV